MAKKYEAFINNPCGFRDCILIVCPPSHDQQGAKFEATMDAIRATLNIQGIWLADALDEHNTGSLDAALTRGDEWLWRHRALLPDVPVTRWTQIRGMDGFEAKYREIRRLYAEDPYSRKAVDNICHAHAMTILARQREKGLNPPFGGILLKCVNYMLEEIAGLSVIRDLTAAPEVYPGEHFADPMTFDRRASVSLRLPSVLPVTFQRAEGLRRTA